MLKKQITYTDLNGVQQTEEHIFNLSRLDLMKMNKDYKDQGGLGEAFNKAMENKDEQAAVDIFVDLILRSYGEKSADGKGLVKNKELSEKFANTEAFNALFDELSTDSAAATAFFTGVLPASLQNGALPLG